MADKRKREEDVDAAVALLQRLSDGAPNSDVVSKLSEEARAHIGKLAEEAKRVMGWVPTEVLWEGAGDAKFYNEVRGSKNCRPAYAKVVDILDNIMKTEPKRINDFPQVSLKEFKGDNRLYHMPRMLTAAENKLLVQGIAQRAQAIRQLLLDRNKSKDTDSMDSIKAGALPMGVLERVSARAAETHICDSLSTSDLYWNIWYGCDIIRGPDGKFYVL